MDKIVSCEFVCSWFWPRLASFPLFVACLNLLCELSLPYILYIFLLLFFLMIYVVYLLVFLMSGPVSLVEIIKILWLCTPTIKVFHYTASLCVSLLINYVRVLLLIHVLHFSKLIFFLVVIYK